MVICLNLLELFKIPLHHRVHELLSYRLHQLQYWVPIARPYNFLFPAPISATLADMDFHLHQPKMVAALNAAPFASARREHNYFHLLSKADNPYERIILLVSENNLAS